MVSLLGTWMQVTGQAWLVLTMTGSAFRLGVISTVQWTPVLLLSLYAGVVADRFPKRRILIVTQSGMCLLALTVAWLTLSGRVEYWHLLVAAALVGTLQAFDFPTRQAFTVEMVGRDDLLNAIALNSSIFNLARVVGPAAAGLVIETFGIGWAFLLNGVSYFGVLYVLAVMRVPDRIRAREDKAIAEIRAGLGYIGRTRVVLGLMVLIALVSVFALNFNVLVPLLVRNVLGGEAREYGFMMSAMGVGALTGSLSLATFGAKGRETRLALAGVLVLGLSQLGLAVITGWTLSAAALFVCGAAMVTFATSSNTAIQLTVPDELRGRVMSVHSLVFIGVTPLGAFITGSLAEYLGSSVTFGVAGAIAILTGLGIRASGLLRATTAADRTEASPRPAGRAGATDGRGS